MALVKTQRNHLADKLMDSANIFLATLVAGQFVEKTIHGFFIFGGLIFYITSIILTTKLKKGK